MKKKIETNKAPKALGTYSQAISVGNTIYLSGQIPLDPKTSSLVDGAENQIRQVFKNLKAICEEAKVSLNDIVKLNVYLQDLSIFSSVNEIMKEFFEEPYPARAAVQVAKLPLDAQIEVEGIIIKGETYTY
tara:strand:+ start:110 stop:502 length:393 start_codon:yes stop_codon:yes gene_type:complete